ncbi:hypothetical protein ACF08B_38060 [Streptomyces sp. NPDC015139]|uniref:hypothetical protein n=1 Tax=Streptomyces sp. NPDC015139 TaxID=3364942 RepID=UPI0036FFD165
MSEGSDDPPMMVGRLRQQDIRRSREGFEVLVARRQNFSRDEQVADVSGRRRAGQLVELLVGRLRAGTRELVQ